MKRLAIALVVIGLLTVSQVTHAANLEEGWYVKLGGVGISGFTPMVGPWNYEWDFTSPLGTTGPYTVTQPTTPDLLFTQRMVFVQNNVSNVSSGTAVDLYGQLRYAIPSNAVITGIDAIAETNYDATQMQLQLYVQHSDGSSQLLSKESRSGHHTSGFSLQLPWQAVLPTDAIFFRVVAVPEPSTGLALLLPTVGLLWIRRRGVK